MMVKEITQNKYRRLPLLAVLLSLILIACGPNASVPNNVTQASDIITLFNANNTNINSGDVVKLSWTAKPITAEPPLVCSLLSKSSTSETNEAVECESSLEVAPLVDTSFQLLAQQGLERYLSETLSITVLASEQNQAPFVSGDEYQLPQGGKLTVSADKGVLANDIDANNDVMTVKLVENVRYGELNLAQDGSFSYQHDASTHLLDYFTYIASDGKADSTTVTVLLTINAALPRLETKPDSYELLASTTLTIDKANGVLANDGLSSDVSVKLDEKPAHGSLSLNEDGSFSYTHDGTASTTDSFSYIAIKAGQSSESTKVSLSIKAQPEPVPTPKVLTIPIRTSGDDTEEFDLLSRSPGEMTPTSPDLDIGSDGAGDKLVGLRFTDIALAPGTEIKSAYLQFQADESDKSNGSPRVAIYLIDEANAAPFSTAKRGLSSRAWKFMLAWEPKSWPKLSERGENQRIDVTKLVETALAKSDWKSGNAIAIVLDNYRGGLRVAESYDEDPKGAATLVITTK